MIKPIRAVLVAATLSIAASVFPAGPAAAAVPANTVFQLHRDGSIWQSTGATCNGAVCPGWIQLDNSSATVAISAGAGTVFQLRRDGSILRSTGVACSGSFCGGWQQLDNNPATVAITASNGT